MKKIIISCCGRFHDCWNVLHVKKITHVLVQLQRQQFWDSLYLLSQRLLLSLDKQKEDDAEDSL